MSSIRKLKKIAQEHHGFGYTQKVCSSYEMCYFTKRVGTAWKHAKMVISGGTITSWKKHQWKAKNV